MPGRKPAHYVTKDNTQIKGLARRPSDKRWRVIGTDITFVCDDEALAIHRYYTEFAQHTKEKTVDLVVPPPAADTPVEQMPVLSTYDPQTQTMVQHLSEAALWSWVREQILERPLYVAEMTGIEQIGYLQDLPKPTPVPTLEEVGNLYFTKKLSGNWLVKCKAFWQEFMAIVAKQTLRQLEQEDFVTYADVVLGASKSPTYARQRFGAIKTILGYPRKRGKWAEHVRRVEAFCGVLVAPSRGIPAPEPIDVEDFHALYKAADAEFRALLLLALNCCLYGGEAAVLTWPDLNLKTGVLAGSRGKTGVIRIAVLWPETIKALRQLPRTDAALFHTSTGTQADYLSTQRRFIPVRKAAGCPRVQLKQIRDGAYTAAVEAGVELHLCRLLAGHSAGVTDDYAMRKPTMVAPACEAIRTAYRIEQL